MNRTDGNGPKIHMDGFPLILDPFYRGVTSQSVLLFDALYMFTVERVTH